MGTAFVAIRGGRRKRGLVVIGLVLFILLAHGSSWYVVVFVRVIGCVRSLSCTCGVVYVHYHLRVLSFALVVVASSCEVAGASCQP